MLGDTFKFSELCCPCCQACNMNKDFFEILESVQKIYPKKMTIDSGYRCDDYNAKIGGGPLSPHLFGSAVLVEVVKDKDKFHLVKAAQQCGINAICIYKLHIRLELRMRNAPSLWPGIQPVISDKDSI